ncbi:nitroreductase family protein [Solirubrobacter sp. CPCC 204708]|uniref:Nitroreductase family protein n=1 Tax=Solirubrobacter deserti TaxID=2282478 RepID=A0ABT4RPA6_9ACTN|nr:nitroreductase family protein [Solirubrobacter deserti]MBE2318355.1 nitroreductase family protein [Solirubrobacter deserti]MDA0140125.1 nitroreductase family protein [Solirubrobacter deserti]
MVDLILNRRSRRDGFQARPVPKDTIDTIIACALAAPSSKNAQPWRIHVVTSRATLGEIADAVDSARGAETYVPIDPATGLPRDYESSVSESAQVLRGVSLGLFVENRGRFSDGRRVVASAADGVRENALIGYSLEMVGLGATIQNMWLAASALGLAGVFMGDVLIAEEMIRERLGLAGDLVGVLALGYTEAESFPKRLGEDRVVLHD